MLQAAAATRLAAGTKDASPWAALAGFRLNAPRDLAVRLQSGGRTYEVVADAGPSASTLASGGHVVVFEDGEAFDFTDLVAADDEEATSGDGVIRSPMPGRIVAIMALAGATVAKGAPLVTLEAMKMEHVLVAPFDGVVAEVRTAAGDQVSEGAVLVRLDGGDDA